MSLISRISIMAILSFCLPLMAQNDSSTTKKNKYKFLYDQSRQKTGDVSLSFQKPTSTGNNFLGNAYEGKNGYNISLRFYVYRQFFIGATLGTSNFSVTDSGIAGNISSTGANESFAFVGYEFLPFKNVRLGVNTSFVGSIKFKNKVPNSDGNTDDGNLFSYGAYVSYEFTQNLSVFFDFALRQTNTNIEVPDALQSVFKKGTYQTINFGLRFSFGNYDAIRHVTL